MPRETIFGKIAHRRDRPRLLPIVRVVRRTVWSCNATGCAGHVGVTGTTEHRETGCPTKTGSRTSTVGTVPTSNGSCAVGYLLPRSRTLWRTPSWSFGAGSTMRPTRHARGCSASHAGPSSPPLGRTDVGRPSGSASHPNPTWSTASLASEVASRADLLRAWRRLNDGEREVLSLVAWDGLSVREAAIVLGCQPGTYRVRLLRARRHLLHILEHIPLTDFIPAVPLSEGAQ